MNEYFNSGATLPLEYRRRQLIALAKMMQDNVVAIEDALLADLGRQRQETTIAECSPVVQACLTALNHLEEWTKPEKPQVEAWRSNWDTTIYPTPKGVALFITYVPYPRHRITQHPNNHAGHGTSRSSLRSCR